MFLISKRIFLLAAVYGTFSQAWLLPNLPASASETGQSKDGRVALRGYDPVSYFTDRHPVKGLDSLRSTFDGTTYLFASVEHRDMFAADPEHYAPQYAGYCAGGIAAGSKIEGDPEAYLISNGRLFVFWSKDEIPVFQAKSAQVTSEADKRWQSMFGGR